MFNAVTDWKGPCCKGKSCLVLVLQPCDFASSPWCDFFVLWLFPESIDGFGAAAALPALKTFLFGRLSPQEYFLFFPVCLHVVVALPFLNPPYGISRWLVVLRCFWSLSGLAEMACWYSLSSTNHLLIFFYAIFILTLPLTACQKCLYSCISSVCGSGTTKSPITRLMDISWPY